MTREEACYECTAPKCGAVCALLQPEWPPRTQDEIAEAEAMGEAYAGQANNVERLRIDRTIRTNHIEFGTGGLFDHLGVDHSERTA